MLPRDNERLCQQRGHDCLLHVQPVFCFVENPRLAAFDHLVGDFLAAMRGQTMQEDRVRRGPGHDRTIHEKALERLLPPFRLVSPEAHANMLGAADKEARLAIERDPDLKAERGQAIQLALALFGYADAAELARSG